MTEARVKELEAEVRELQSEVAGCIHDNEVLMESLEVRYKELDAQAAMCQQLREEIEDILDGRHTERKGAIRELLERLDDHESGHWDRRNIAEVVKSRLEQLLEVKPSAAEIALLERAWKDAIEATLKEYMVWKVPESENFTREVIVVVEKLRAKEGK